MLKFGNGPWLVQVLNYAIGPAQEPPPLVHQQVRDCGHASMRVMHHPFCLANLPFDVEAICLHQVHKLRLSDKRRRSARQQSGTAGRKDAAYGTAETASHGAFLR